MLPLLHTNVVVSSFFLLCNIVIEMQLMRSYHKDEREREENRLTKERPVSNATGYSEPSAAPVAPAQNDTAPVNSV